MLKDETSVVSRRLHDGLQLFVTRLMARSILTADEQQAVLSLPARPITVRAKQDFVHEGEDNAHCSLIASGLVGRFRQLRSGTRQITAFHIPGDMADLSSIVRPVGIGGLHALTEVTVLRVPHEAIRSVAARYPAVAEAFWRDCMLDAAILMQWVVNVGRRDARARLAHLFCEMSIRYGIDRGMLTAYDFPVTQEQLGEAVALTAVHVNRSLKALREEKLISIGSGRVIIHDWDQLTKLGAFDSGYLIDDTLPVRKKRLLGGE